MSSTAPDPVPLARAHASFQLWLVNVLVGVVVGSAWLVRVPEDLSAWTRAYVAVALLASVAVLGSIPGLGFVLVHRLVRRRWRLAGLLQACLGTAFLGLLYTDTIVHTLLGYHFNGQVLNVALTPDSGDAVNLGRGVWGTVIGFVLAGVGLQYVVWRAALGRMESRLARGLGAPLLLQPRVILLLVLLPAIGIEKSVYAAAEIQGDEEVLWASEPLPLYPRVRVGRVLDPEGTRLPQLEVAPRAAILEYPRTRPVLPADGPRPNLFLLVLDTWRRDMFTPEQTPALAAFAAGARVFANHLSAGNDTRYGLFSMLYGLHGSYWAKVKGAQHPPALIEALQEEGYDVRVFSAASMNFPAFRRTAWVGLRGDQIVDEYRDHNDEERSELSWVKDGFVADEVEAWLEQRRAEQDGRPFFCFVLLDGPHQPYFNPGGPHQPSVERVDYFELGRISEGPEHQALVGRVTNTYRNCLLQADVTAGRILGALERSGGLDETVVLVTGDHGEEFWEHGYFGHTSNFSAEQIEVPFYLSGPGIAPGVETRPTSHLDVSNSLLELLGADPAQRGGYSLGESLFAPPAQRARVTAGAAHIGVWTADDVHVRFTLGTEEVEAYDRDWQRLGDVLAHCSRYEHVLLRTADECVRFLQR